MPRIIGVDIPAYKRIEYSLCYIYGVGHETALKILEKAKIPVETKASKLTDEQLAAIASILQNDLVVEGDLRRMIASDIRRLQSINCYRGSRHRRNLPCRGQRTKTNSRTRKGRKQTVGAIRDKTQRKLAGKDTPAGGAGAPAAAAPAADKKKK